MASVVEAQVVPPTILGSAVGAQMVQGLGGSLLGGLGVECGP